MFTRSLLITLASLSLFAAAGCAASDNDAEDADSTANELGAKDMKNYGMSVGVVATGAEARALFAAIKKSGGKDLGNHSVLAGFTAKDVGLAEPGDDDAFGITCQAAEGDPTFHADTCSLAAIVESKGQTRGVTKLTGKLAKAVAQALPRTSPDGLVGSTTTSSGPVSCTSIPGPAGATCTVRGTAVFSTFEQLIAAPKAGVTAADAKKAIKAFFGT